jgi:Tol biopolymer transport system component
MQYAEHRECTKRRDPPDSRVANAAAQLWVKHLDRGPATRVADVGSFPTWSPDGTALVFTAYVGARLMTVPADGSVLPSAIPGTGTRPHYSPDGQWLLYHSGSDIQGRRTTGDMTPVIVVQNSRVRGVFRSARMADGSRMPRTRPIRRGYMCGRR